MSSYIQYSLSFWDVHVVQMFAATVFDFFLQANHMTGYKITYIKYLQFGVFIFLYCSTYLCSNFKLFESSSGFFCRYSSGQIKLCGVILVWCLNCWGVVHLLLVVSVIMVTPARFSLLFKSIYLCTWHSIVYSIVKDWKHTDGQPKRSFGSKVRQENYCDAFSR